MFKKIVIWSIALFVLIQLIPIDRINKPVIKTQNFINIFQTPGNVQEILKNSCYDCHSNETRYPKYAYVAPFSWSLKNHVNEGREHLNFSVWGSYNLDLKKNMLTNSVEAVRNHTMPLPGYIAFHPEANLTGAQRTVLQNYFHKILISGEY